jgi:hypothetical protein
MSDRPWLELSDPALRAERELLKRLSSEQPPSGSVEQGWAALSAEIAGLQALGAAGSATVDAAHSAAQASSTGGSFAFAAKVVASVAIAGGTVWGGSQLLATSDSASVQPRTARPAPQVAPAPRAVAPQPPPLSSNAADDQAVAKPAAASNSPRPAASTTSLAEEGRLLAKARQLVLSGQGQRALEVLRLSESRYPRSVLSPEREVITIEALAATGATGSARQRSERFLKRYPASPHAGRLQRFVE